MNKDLTLLENCFKMFPFIFSFCILRLPTTCIVTFQLFLSKPETAPNGAEVKVLPHLHSYSFYKLSRNTTL